MDGSAHIRLQEIPTRGLPSRLGRAKPLALNIVLPGNCPMMRARLLRILIASLLGLVFAALIAWWSVQQDRRAAASSKGTMTLSSSAAVGGAFTLVDHTGRTVTQDILQGKYSLIFFGFTFCPDICPTELQVMAQALDLLEGDAARVQPLFITIDPARDTPEQMAQYVELFHPAIRGLTGTPEQIEAAARAYRVYYARASGGTPDAYTMDHSAYTYLMGPDGMFLTVFPRGTTAEEMAGTIRDYMRNGS